MAICLCLSSTAESARTVQFAERTRTATGDLRGCTGRAAMSPALRFEVKELGAVDMVSMALAMLDLGAVSGDRRRISARLDRP